MHFNASESPNISDQNARKYICRSTVKAGYKGTEPNLIRKQLTV